MTQHIRLSICIATYNRSAYIMETLDSIIGQLGPEDELVVVDGASTDETSQVVEAVQARCPSVRYYREIDNSGVDRDYDKAVSYARGEYIWLMTDDDLLVQNAIHSVTREIEQTQDELIIVNAEVRTADLASVLCRRMLNFDNDREYSQNNGAELFMDTANRLTFIGGLIMKRDLWLSRDRISYYGSLFIHVGIVFQAPIAKARVLAEPLVQIRYGVAMWTPRSFEIWMYKWPCLIWSFANYDAKAKRRITAREPWRNPMTLFHYRSKGAYGFGEYARFLSGSRNLAYRLSALVISVFPTSFANLLSLVYVSSKRKGNLIPVYDLVNSRRPGAIKRALVWLYRV